jgi:hypothetical protein
MASNPGYAVAVGEASGCRSVAGFQTTGSYIKIGLPPIPETLEEPYSGGAIVAGAASTALKKEANHGFRMVAGPGVRWRRARGNDADSVDAHVGTPTQTIVARAESERHAVVDAGR